MTQCTGGFKGNNAANNPDDKKHDVEIPDWVDESVVGWLSSELKKMDAVWGPSSRRGALAFMHIPPYVLSLAGSEGCVRVMWFTGMPFSIYKRY